MKIRAREAFGVALIMPRPTSFADTNFHAHPSVLPESAVPGFAVSPANEPGGRTLDRKRKYENRSVTDPCSLSPPLEYFRV